MTSSSPVVTVLLPVCNGERYIGEAIDSILTQTFRDFELLIVDDGSTDGTRAILEACGRRDGRIRVDYQPHRGLVPALNHALPMTTGRYVARMDADDLSMAERLERQVAFLDSHPNVGVCGTWAELFGLPFGARVEPATDHEQLICQLLFESPLAHPSAMLRRQILVETLGGYDPALPCAEDYDLWARAAGHTRLANIPQRLMRLRQHPQQVTRRHHDVMEESSRRVRAREVAALGLHATEAELALHGQISRLLVSGNRDFIDRAEAWLLRLLAANRVSNARPEPAFTETIQRQWFRICAAKASATLWLTGRFWRSPLSSPWAWHWNAPLVRLSARGVLGRPVLRHARAGVARAFGWAESGSW